MQIPGRVAQSTYYIAIRDSVGGQSRAVVAIKWVYFNVIQV